MSRRAEKQILIHSKKLPSPVRPSDQHYVLFWSQDSLKIYVASSLAGEARLDAVDVQSGKTRKVAAYGSDIDFQTPINVGLSGYLSTDGKSFVTTVLNSKSDLWILEGFPRSLR